VTSLGRNDPCHCGSGKKYKQCHLAKDEAAAREARAEAAEAAPPPTADAAPQRDGPRPGPRPPGKGGHANTRGFTRITATRKVGG
jgi:hypothetical protein